MPFFNVTSTATFLSCTSPPVTLPPPLVTQTALSSVTQTLYTSVYETVLPAACETSQWIATYTITEICSGNPSDYVTSAIPPGFVVTTVVCPSCQPTEIEITCPGAQPTRTGSRTVAVTGNGVTATIPASPADTGNPGVKPVGIAIFPGTASSGTSNAGSPPGPSSSCSGSGGCAGLGSGSRIGSGPGSGSSAGSSPGPGSGSGSICGSVSCTSSGPSSGSEEGNNGTHNIPPYVLTAGAASGGNAAALFSGLAFVAGHFFLL